MMIMSEYLSVRKGKGEDPLLTTLNNMWKRLLLGGVSKVVSFVAKKVTGENERVLGRSLKVRGEILKMVANWKSDAIWEYMRAARVSSMRILELMGFGSTLPPLLGSSEGKRG
jgi:hypothetical protein